jgi:large subunit ribosomal protein L17
MRHLNKGRKFGRTSSHRNAMFRNMAAALFVHEKIETSHAKAAKNGDVVGKPLSELNAEDRARQVHLRRQICKFLPKYYDDGKGELVDLMHKLFFVFGPRFKERPGGYTRVTKLGPRRGDASPISRIEILS